MVISYSNAPSFETNCSWKLSKADWNTFWVKAASELKRENILYTEDPVGYFTEILTSIANNTIPKSKPKTVKHNTIWFNDDCKAATKNRKNHSR